METGEQEGKEGEVRLVEKAEKGAMVKTANLAVMAGTVELRASAAIGQIYKIMRSCIMKIQSSRPGGATLIELLVALAIVLALAALLLPFLFGPPGITPAAPNVVLVGTWTTAPTSITVGQTATFVLNVQRVNTGASSAALVNEPGTGIQFVTGPGTIVQIVSLNGTAVGSDQGQANTDGNGNVTVVVSAASVPPASGGALIAVPVGRSAPVVVTRFEIAP